MIKLMLYLLEVSAVVAILYACYFALLRKETFFDLNRAFLLGIMIISFLFPLVNLDFLSSSPTPINDSIDQLRQTRMTYFEALESWSTEGYSIENNHVGISKSDRSVSTKSYRVVLIGILSIYLFGVVVALSRLLWAYYSVLQLRWRYDKEQIDDTLVVKLPYPTAPFSFLNTAFICEEEKNDEALGQILAHEKVHIQQWHSVDLIFVQLLGAVLWFNPVVWLLIKSLKTTHEYIADRKIISQGYSLVRYQSLLLSQLISNNSIGLVHNFNLTFIKKRITMMNIERSGWIGKAKVAASLSLTIALGLIMMQCNTTLDEQSSTSGVRDIDDIIDWGTESVSYVVPTLPKSEFKYKGTSDNTMQIEIYDDQIHVDKQLVSLCDLPKAIKSSKIDRHGIVLMLVDHQQTMSLVRAVEWELRKINRRKVIYSGKTEEGSRVEVKHMLAPAPGNSYGIELHTVDDAYAKAHDLDILKVDLNGNLSSKDQKRVYDFVMAHVKVSKSNYMVSAKYDDDTYFGDYLANMIYIRAGFNQIYQERSQKMFGKNFFELDKSNPEEKTQYNAVRKGIPMAISIAEI